MSTKEAKLGDGAVPTEMRSPEGAQKQQATPAPGANGRSGGYEADSSGANRARRSRSLSAAVVAKDRWERGAASGPAATSARGVASPTTRMLLTSGSGGGSGRQRSQHVLTLSTTRQLEAAQANHGEQLSP